MENIKMFNFKENWNLVEPHLNKPEILDLLDNGMREYFADNPGAVRLAWDKDGHKGPWLFSKCDCWSFTTEKRFVGSKELADLMSNYEILAEEAGIDFNEILCADPKDLPLDSLGMQYWNEWYQVYDSCLPQPNTYEWYQCLGAEEHLALWQKALAEKLFPDYQWKIYQTDVCCNDGHPLIGIGPEGDVLIFDIVNFDKFSAAEILDSTGLAESTLAA